MMTTDSALQPRQLSEVEAATKFMETAARVLRDGGTQIESDPKLALYMAAVAAGTMALFQLRDMITGGLPIPPHLQLAQQVVEAAKNGALKKAMLPEAEVLPPAPCEIMSWHWLRRDGTFICATWIGDRWGLVGILDDLSPQQIAAGGWSYAGPCLPPTGE